jgi:nicotinamide-nucleotide amidase
VARAHILTIGDELLSGETVDTNSSWLDGQLERIGWTVVRHSTVLDEVDAIADAFRAAADDAELVISSGGLGPTADDLTLEAFAKALGCGLRLDEAVLESIRRKFERLGRPMSPNNERQAWVPELGEVVPNDVGTAPAFTAMLGGARVFLCPGVPRELRWLFEHRIRPVVDRGAPAAARRTVKVVGLGESRLEHAIKEVVRAHPAVRFGFRALGVENHVKLHAAGEDGAAAVAAAEAALRDVLGPRIFGVDDDEHSAVLGAQLARRGETVATAESCTGGLVAKSLTDVPGSSAWVLGGVVAYANAVKCAALGVSEATLAAHGAVSREVACEMAVGARDRLGATWGVATTGIAGPDGGSEAKPVGLVWMALAGPEGVEAHELRSPGDRAQVRANAAMAALELLRRKTA